MDSTKEYILCAAVKRKKPRESAFPDSPYPPETNDIMNIEIGYRHHDIYIRFANEDVLDYSDTAQGFYTSKGRFVDRWEGMEVAYDAGQVDEYRALNKDWWHEPHCRCYDRDGNLMAEEEYWKEHDTHKFNILISENLY